MGILDDAIKEHLELKRQHGADASELKQLEDEAFGAAERPGGEPAAPDPVAEAPTEFMEQPSKRAPRAEIADLQEAPAPPAPAEPEEPQAPAEEESPAMEHEAVPEPEEQPASHSTEEREQIAEQPTEMFEVPEELDEEEPEPVDEGEDEEVDDFWDEKRLSDELDDALEGPSDLAEEPEPEEPVAEESAAEEPAVDEPEADEPESEEHDALEDTPDFLEEAPEDDQLWFEQKPPKDFDFDD